MSSQKEASSDFGNDIREVERKLSPVHVDPIVDQRAGLCCLSASPYSPLASSHNAMPFCSSALLAASKTSTLHVPLHRPLAASKISTLYVPPPLSNSDVQPHRILGILSLHRMEAKHHELNTKIP